MIRLLIFFLLFIPNLGRSQDQKVDLKAFDSKLLADCLLKEVNQLRTRKRLDSLVKDEILIQAAKDQADYMAARQQLGHGQKSKIKGSPYKRVLFYGGSHNMVGENVMVFDLERAIKKSKNRLTYQRLARDMVKDWAKSREHNANIMEPGYANIGHEFALLSGKLFTCQVFGSKPFVESYEFTEGTEIYVKDGKECYDCKRVQEKIYKDEVNLGWYTVSNDSIYYWNVNHYRKGRFYRKKKENYLLYSNKNNLNKIFKSNGIITVDLTHNEQFDCSGKPSFHNSPYHNGYYLGYLNKSIVLQNDIYPSDEIVQVFVGMKPVFNDTFFQVDFHLIKQKKYCIQTSTIYVTPDHFKPSEYFKLPQPTMGLDKKLVIQDSIVTRIPFERNQTNEDTSIFRPLVASLDSLIQDAHQIERIYFTGVASIEGTLKANRKLILRRGGIIEEYLKRYYPDIPFESKFYENFDDFKSGLVAAGYVDATEISNDTLRMFANDQKDDKEIAKILDQSRYSTVKIVFKDDFLIEEGSYGLSIERINDLLAEGKINEAIPLYLVMANSAIAGESDQGEDLLALQFPKEVAYAKLNWYQFLLDLALNNPVVTAERLNDLKTIGAIKSDADYLEYRLLFNLFNRNMALNVDDKSAVMANLRSKRLD